LCSLEFLLESVSKKWALLIIVEIDKHKKLRYNELYSKIEGIGPSTLSTVLKRLEEINLIKREVFTEIPPKVEYSLSKKGEEFQELVRPLIKWADKNEFLNKNCKCNTVEKEPQGFSKLRDKSLRKLIEVSMCACACLPMMVLQLPNLI